MSDYKNKLSGFAQKLKDAPAVAPMQEVSLVIQREEKKMGEERSALNIWIPKTLKRRMREKELEIEETLTNIAIMAIEEFLKK